ncbi:PrgI family protein, partial [Streptomyces sp. SBT349]|uniref:PrgI family protein n=1 Tax=Streptomyces sp. SBT349 TaxID=1580539 RepID=UPI00099B8097
EDTVLAGLTARQLLILSGAGILLYALYSATRTVLPVAVFLAAALPLGAVAVLLALGRRDGLPLDQLLRAAIRQTMAPRYRIAAPQGIQPAPTWLAARAAPLDEPGQPTGKVSPAPLRLPAEAVTETGVIDLGRDGMAVVAVCSTVNFALRTPTEQESLTAAFAGFLHSLTAPVQILIRAEHLDVSAQITELRTNAPHLPHPALAHAALEHADYLTQLREHSNLLRRQVLLVARESLHASGPRDQYGASPRTARRRAGSKAGRSRPAEAEDAARRAAEARLVRRIAEAVELLGPVGIIVTPLDAGQATAVLAAACNPDSLLPPSSHLAGAHDVITTAPAFDDADPAKTPDGSRDTDNGDFAAAGWGEQA